LSTVILGVIFGFLGETPRILLFGVRGVVAVGLRGVLFLLSIGVVLLLVFSDCLGLASQLMWLDVH
jgi:hypothetical protein